MAERYPVPDISGQPPHPGVQLRETAIHSCNDIVYGDKALVKAYLEDFFRRRRSRPNTGVILKSFEEDIVVRLIKGNLYAKGTHYDVTKSLGKGAFGTVYLCTDKKSKMEFVIKHVKLADNAMHYKSLEREVYAMLRLDHRHVIKFYGIIQREDNSFDVLLEPWGESLKSYLTSRDDVPSNDKYQWFCQLFLVLIYIHEKGLVHCDLHFGNILIQNNLLKLCDFGSAKKNGENLFTQSHGNTPMYFPPTVLKHYHSGKQLQVSPRLDTYAVGKLLLEVLSRRWKSPIDDMTLDIISDKTKWDDFVKSKLPEDTPMEIQMVIMGLISFTTADGITVNYAKEILDAKLDSLAMENMIQESKQVIHFSYKLLINNYIFTGIEFVANFTENYFVKVRRDSYMYEPFIKALTDILYMSMFNTF